MGDKFVLINGEYINIDLVATYREETEQVDYSKALTAKERQAMEDSKVDQNWKKIFGMED
jgi:hypothetical protein